MTEQQKIIEKVNNLEKYVESNEQKVLKSVFIGLLTFIFIFLLLIFIPESWKNNVGATFFTPNTQKEQEQKEVQKAERRNTLRLSPISAKYNEEQTKKYIEVVEKYIDKYQGDQYVYQNVLEFISDHCINPNNNNTKLLVQSLLKSMDKHTKYFDENNKAISSLVDKCTTPIDVIDLPVSLKLAKTDVLRLQHSIAARKSEIEKIQLKYGKDIVDPQTGDLILSFKSDAILMEERKRKERYAHEDDALKIAKEKIYSELDILYRSKKEKGNKNLFYTIMRDYPDDFDFFYDWAAKRDPEDYQNLRQEVQDVLRRNQQKSN